MLRIAPSKPLARFVVLTALLSLAAWTALAISSSAAQEAKDVVLELTLEDAGPFVIGEPVFVQLKITNRSDVDVRLASPSLKEGRGELAVTDPQGKVLKYSGSHLDKFSIKVERLAPGESMTARENVEKCYDLSHPGTYKAHAVVWTMVPQKELVSGKIEFAVEKPNGKFTQEARSLEPLRDGSGDGGRGWEVFTHVRGGVPGVYVCCLMGEGYRRHQFFFEKLGDTSSESPRDISCLGDTEGQLHVLYPVAGKKDTYAYHVVGLDEGDGKHQRLVRLYTPEEGAKPTLGHKVYVKWAKPVAADEKAPDSKSQPK